MNRWAWLCSLKARLSKLPERINLETAERLSLAILTENAKEPRHGSDELHQANASGLVMDTMRRRPELGVKLQYKWWETRRRGEP